MTVSTTTAYWAIQDSSFRAGDLIFLVDCFVAPNGYVIPVPGNSESNYAGFAWKVGKDVFLSFDEALVEATRRAERSVAEKSKWLNEAKRHLERIRKLKTNL